MAKLWAQAFYKSKAWRSTRECVLRRDMYTCHDCGGRGEEIHHIVELTEANINDPAIALGMDNLVLLCGDCHKKRTLSKGDAADGYEFDESGQLVKVNPAQG